MSKDLIEKKIFFNFSLEELREYLASQGYKSFTATQLWKWVYQKGVLDPHRMTNIPQGLKNSLHALFLWNLPDIHRHSLSRDGTLKLLLRSGEYFFETVLIPSSNRATVCVSSEVGCNLACKFCFTGKQKLKKRLEPYEIVGQIFLVRQFLFQNPKIYEKLFKALPSFFDARFPLTNIVFMGMGEPLDNSQSVFKSIETFADKDGLNFSKNKITISTSGLVNKIPLVAQAGVRLAVSLNGSNDLVRSQIMPINNKWPIDVLLKSCQNYIKTTKQKVTFEYVLLKGVTDSLLAARELAFLLKDIRCKVNLIPFNEHRGSEFCKPDDSTVHSFASALRSYGVPAFLRKTMGDDIYAACGQLTSAYQDRI